MGFAGLAFHVYLKGRPGNPSWCPNHPFQQPQTRRRQLNRRWGREEQEEPGLSLVRDSTAVTGTAERTGFGLWLFFKPTQSSESVPATFLDLEKPHGQCNATSRPALLRLSLFSASHDFGRAPAEVQVVAEENDGARASMGKVPPWGVVTHHELLWGTYQEPHGFVTQSYTLAGAGRQLMGFYGAGCSEGSGVPPARRRRGPATSPPFQETWGGGGCEGRSR